MGRTAKNSSKNLRTELRTQFRFIVTTCIELWKEMGYTNGLIEEIIYEFDRLWSESETSGVVMLQMCEDETGIEMRLDGGQSFHDIKLLNFNASGGRCLTNEQKILINNVRRKWSPGMCMAGICIAMYRVLKMDTEGILDFILIVDKKRRDKHSVDECLAQMESYGLSHLFRIKSADV